MQFILLFIAGLALSARQLTSAMYMNRLSVVDILTPRQSSIDPGFCTSICAPFEVALDSCPDTEPLCFCTDVVEASLQSCIDCFVAGDPEPEVLDDVLNITSTFNDLCFGGGVPLVTIPSIPGTPQSTFPGGNPSTSRTAPITFSSITVPTSTVVSISPASPLKSIPPVQTVISTLPESSTSTSTSISTTTTGGLSGVSQGSPGVRIGSRKVLVTAVSAAISMLALISL